MLSSDIGLVTPQKNCLSNNKRHLPETVSCRSATETSSGSGSFMNSEAVDFGNHSPPFWRERINSYQDSLYCDGNDNDDQHPFAADKAGNVSDIEQTPDFVSNQSTSLQSESGTVSQSSNSRKHATENKVDLEHKKSGKIIVKCNGKSLAGKMNHLTELHESSIEQPKNIIEQQQQELPNDSLPRSDPANGEGCSQTTSQLENVDVELIPDCEVKRYVIAIGKTLSKTEDDLYPILIRLVRRNWLEDIEHLQGLSESDWAQMEIPHQMARLLRRHLPAAHSIAMGSTISNRPKRQSSVDEVVAQMAASHLSSPKLNYSAREPPTDIHGNYVKPVSCNTAGTLSSGLAPIIPATHLASSNHPHNAISSMEAFPSVPVTEGNDVEVFIRRVCTKYGRSKAELEAAVQCLVCDNWFDSVNQLKALTPGQWEVLELPVGLAPLLLRALAEEEFFTDDSLERIIIKVGSSMGRTGVQLTTAITRLKQHGYQNAAELQDVTETEWSNLRLPLRLLEEIQKDIANGLPECRSPVVTQSMNVMPGPRYESTSIIPDEIRPIPPHHDPRIVTDRESRERRLMTVDRFLLKVGLSVGRSEDEMQPIIHKIVKENWFDSLSALRQLDVEEWNTFGLPKRLIDAIRHGLSDTFMLELNTVQFTVPEPELFPCDVIAAVWKLEAEVLPDLLPDSLRSLLKLMETILCNPFDEAKRIIRKNNANFQKRAGQYRSGILILESVGYEDKGDCYLLPVAYISRITEAHAALAQVAQIHRDRLRKRKTTSKLFSSFK